MRRSFFWALGGTAVLSIATLWSSDVPRVVAAMEPRVREAIGARETILLAPGARAAEASGPLPAELPKVALELAKRDVFVPFARPLPPASPAPSPQPPVVVAPSVPQAPATTLRFLGSMVTPMGQRLVYLARGDLAVQVAVGDRLDEGYVVNAIAEDGVTLVYPPLDMRAVVPISQPALQ